MAIPRVTVVRPWAADGLRHGGWRRSQQIDELLASAGVGFDVCTTVPAKNFDPRGFLPLLRAGPRAWNHSNLIDAVSRTRRLRETLPHDCPALVEMPHNPVIEQITATRCTVRVAIPQNIESFNEPAVRSWRMPDRGARAAAEIRLLACYDAVFTIALEECWLLANAGLDARFLPYSPPRLVAEWLRRLRMSRASRAAHPDDEVVVLGTAQARHAEATVRLVGVLQAAGLRPVVVGYNTASLLARLGDRADLRGEISTEHLFALLTRCRAVTIFQSGGGGALTRIVELGHAGVPVVVAGVAGRSMYGWQHLTWVNDVEAIPDALPEPGTTISAVDPWESIRHAEEQRLLACLMG